MKFDIKHDEANQKFFVLIGGKESALKYTQINDTLLDYKLLFVPQNMRGQGLASRIAEYAINWAQKKGMKVKASCSYVSEFLHSHKEFADVRYTNQSLLPV